MRVCWPVHSWRLSISRGQWTTPRHCATTTALFQRSGVNNLLRENRFVDFTTQKSTTQRSTKNKFPFSLNTYIYISSRPVFTPLSFPFSKPFASGSSREIQNAHNFPSKEELWSAIGLTVQIDSGSGWLNPRQPQRREYWKALSLIRKYNKLTLVSQPAGWPFVLRVRAVERDLGCIGDFIGGFNHLSGRFVSEINFE